MRVTWADVRAYWLVNATNALDSNATPDAIIEAGDQIIALAESIKAQRLTAAMQARRTDYRPPEKDWR